MRILSFLLVLLFGTYESMRTLCCAVSIAAPMRRPHSEFNSDELSCKNCVIPLSRCGVIQNGIRIGILPFFFLLSCN
jgi:hypothetical protein